MTFSCEQKLRSQVLCALGSDDLFRLLADSEVDVVMKMLGLLRNLLSSRSVRLCICWWEMSSTRWTWLAEPAPTTLKLPDLEGASREWKALYRYKRATQKRKVPVQVTRPLKVKRPTKVIFKQGGGQKLLSHFHCDGATVECSTLVLSRSSMQFCAFRVKKGWKKRSRGRDRGRCSLKWMFVLEPHRSIGLSLTLLNTDWIDLHGAFAANITVMHLLPAAWSVNCSYVSRFR